MSETQTNTHEITEAMDRIAKSEEDKVYRQGLADYVAGRRDSVEAQYYVSYWTAEQALGQTAVKPLAE